MKIAKKIAPLFTAMILCGTLAARPDDGMFVNPLGAPRIKDWVEILYVGPLTSPEPVIWFTHERYRARGINVSIVLSSKNYEHLIRFVRSRDCLALSQIPMETAEIAIIEKSLGSVRRECFYERNSACAIFGKLVQASFTTARPGENDIRHLYQRIGCRMGRAN